jgi:hypothetical protein
MFSAYALLEIFSFYMDQVRVDEWYVYVESMCVKDGDMSYLVHHVHHRRPWI